MARYTKRITQVALLCLGLVIFYVAFLMIGHAIPRSLILANAQRSYRQLDSLGVYFSVVDGASWDNLTDAFFINTAVTEYDGNLLEKALANAYTTTVEDTGWRRIIDSISYAINGGEQTVVEPYSRYWVGMVTVYKILLIFMPLSGIRTFVIGITIILFAITILNIYKMLGIKGIVPFLVSIMLALYIPLAMCLVFSTDVIMMLLMINICYLLIKKNASAGSFYMLFFLAGSLLAYLNYWAFPLIILGFPLVFIVNVRQINGYNTKTLAKEVILMSLCWGGGVSGTILVKQILCRIVLGTQTGTSQLLFRMGSDLTITDRIISVMHGLADQISSPPVLASIIIVTLWSIMLFKTNCMKRKYNCYLLLLITLYPMGWWFVLPNHSTLGFVNHMYGISYYALLTALFMNCKSYIPKWNALRNITLKKIGINTGIIAAWLILSYVLLNAIVHYDTRETEPWSLETIDTVTLENQSITQTVHFDEITYGVAYLKNVSAIIVNIHDDNKDCELHAVITENGNVLSTADVSIKNVEIGEWFKIPLRCVIHSGREYQVTYSIKNNNGVEPFLLVQDDSQAARENGLLYVNGIERSGAITNKYEYDDCILSISAKIAVLFMILFVAQYILFLYENKKDMQSSTTE